MRRAREAARRRGDRRRGARACRCLTARRLWFVGIGGAGMSALAVVTRAWGAEVAGLGSRRDAVSRAARRTWTSRSRRSRPPPPEDWEPVVSTAFVGPGRTGGRGASCSPSSSRSRRSIVVAGAHGKTTTAAMIAFCLRRALVSIRRSSSAGRSRSSVGTHGAGKRVARRRGRRVGSLARAAATRDRRADERRSRPSLDVRFAGRGRGALRLAGSAGCELGRAGRRRSSRSSFELAVRGRAQPAKRGGGARGARVGRSRPG